MKTKEVVEFRQMRRLGKKWLVKYILTEQKETGEEYRVGV